MKVSPRPARRTEPEKSMMRLPVSFFMPEITRTEKRKVVARLTVKTTEICFMTVSIKAGRRTAPERNMMSLPVL